jgi:hypothetical protein
MKLVLVAVLAVAAFTLASCGSSGVSESDAQALLEFHTSLTSPECVKSSAGSDRDFDCTAMSEGNPVTIKVTVGESGESIVVTHCTEQRKYGYREHCDGISQR